MNAHSWIPHDLDPKPVQLSLKRPRCPAPAFVGVMWALGLSCILWGFVGLGVWEAFHAGW